MLSNWFFFVACFFMLWKWIFCLFSGVFYVVEMIFVCLVLFFMLWNWFLFVWWFCFLCCGTDFCLSIDPTCTCRCRAKLAPPWTWRARWPGRPVATSFLPLPSSTVQPRRWPWKSPVFSVVSCLQNTCDSCSCYSLCICVCVCVHMCVCVYTVKLRRQPPLIWTFADSVV